MTCEQKWLVMQQLSASVPMIGRDDCGDLDVIFELMDLGIVGKFATEDEAEGERRRLRRMNNDKAYLVLSTSELADSLF